RDDDSATTVDGVLGAGAGGRGQALIVGASAAGRAAARGLDRFLTGTSALPAPIRPTDRSLLV
ncbi:glutamate synthase, partial [Streptomyces sp. NPDC055080]